MMLDPPGCPTICFLKHILLRDRMTRRAHPLAAAALLLVAAAPSAADEVVVFAAASMKTALDAAAAAFIAETGHTVTLSYAGSNALARQIIAGAPADIFLSAAVDWMDAVEEAGLVVEGTRTDLLGNTLVLVAHGRDVAPVEIGPASTSPGVSATGSLPWRSSTRCRRGSTARPRSKASASGRAVAPSVAQSDNVRAALALVSTGEAPYGIVYATDAAADDNVTIVGTFPADSHPPIVYPGALPAEAADEADRAFLGSLSSDEARAAFAAQGFAILD
jgi:molybdate transport system substrate-binding protein